MFVFEPGEHVKSVAVREHYVQHRDTGRLCRRRFLERFDRAERVAADVTELQRAFDEVAYAVVVFEKINEFFHNFLPREIQLFSTECAM